jgi:hypothetical protein
MVSTPYLFSGRLDVQCVALLSALLLDILHPTEQFTA